MAENSLLMNSTLIAQTMGSEDILLISTLLSKMESQNE
jgi:hypothetical protein